MFILTRAQNILLQPDKEWEAISAEASSTGGLYLDYVIPLASLGPIASFLGYILIPPAPLNLSLTTRLTMAEASFILSLLSVYLVALVIDSLSDIFGGRNSRQQALKLATYSLTPFWLGSVLTFVPLLEILALPAAIYGIYLLYLGLPVLMGSHRDQTLTYTTSVIISALIIQFAFGRVVDAIVDTPEKKAIAANQAAPGWAELSQSDRESLERLREIAMNRQRESGIRHDTTND